jgi:predicted naringenin-chalcone synthase
MQTPLYVSQFNVVRPSFEKPQEDAIRWLAQAHAQAELRAGSPNGRVDLNSEFFEKVIGRFGCSPDKIANRGHELSDFSHTNWDQMRVFNTANSPSGADMEARQRIYDELVRVRCDDLFPQNFRFARDLMHVSCTGYVSPSPLQRLVAERGAASSVRVFHAYHMGCYAALPATRWASAMALQSFSEGLSDESAAVDVAHSELCTLHFNPMLHSPEQLVVQSLFADGFIRYRVSARAQEVHNGRALKILAMNEEQIPGTADAMTWLPLPWGMAMTLSRDVPALISSSVRGFVDRLMMKSGYSSSEILPRLVYAIHPGGPKIIDHLQTLFEATDEQVAASRSVLRRFGNMSSATLPHIWNDILSDSQKYPVGTCVLSLAFGPGLTTAGSLFEVVGDQK